MEHFRKFFRRSLVKYAPKADELLKLCMETIDRLTAQHLSSSTEDDRTEFFLMNKHQCNFLVGRLSETRSSLQNIQLSPPLLPLLDEKTIPVLEELHQVLLDGETVIYASRITRSQWPRAAIEQSGMKETFASLLYGVQWHVSVLQSILMDNSQESSITFEPALCEGELGVGDELSLLTAMKEDEEILKDRLGSLKLDDKIQNWLADELLLKLKMRSEEEDNLNTSSVAGNSTGLSSYPEMLFLDPQYLHLSGKKIGAGVSAEVRKTDLIGGKYAVKIFKTYKTDSFDREKDALQRLGRHPHVVRLLCYSQKDMRCFLIMEKMDKDLQTVLSDISSDRKGKKLTDVQAVQAVVLMLKIGEGVKYIHGKRMAHRDLKSGNVLVNLDPSSKRICSVKIADFGLSKTKNASQTYSNQTVNTGTNTYMAPEVIRQEGDPESPRFNPRKADVYSFAILCVEILTGEDPYNGLSPTEMKKQVKVGTLRPTLPEGCPPKLAALIKRCWHPISHERPLFPEICKELRYIKGLLLRGDQRTLKLQDDRPLRPLDRAQIQGPWGGKNGGAFFDVGTSINQMKLRYSQSPGCVCLMEVDYNLAGSNFVRRYCDPSNWGDLSKDIKFEHFEFITHISGFVSQRDVLIAENRATDLVVSLTIHTNIKSYGPFGDEGEGEPFVSDIGRVIGFHGRCGLLLDSLGVVIQVDPYEQITK